MTKKQKKLLLRIAVSAALFAVAFFLPVKGIFRLFVFLVPYLTVGYSVLFKAGRNILHGQVFDENFLMALATVGALAIGEYPEAVFVMLFYQVGELFESIAVGKSRKSIGSLMDLRPDRATVERDGETVTLSPEEVRVGEILIVKPGEKIPLDGTVLEGSSSLDTVALTGESVPRDVTVGDTAISGCVNLSGLLRLRAEKPYGESTAAKILALVETSSANKAKAENFITVFAKFYTPAVVLAALLVALIPPLFDGAWSAGIYRALSFLVISCPCALVISVPLSFFAGIGGASKKGILVKGSSYLERLASASVVLFDKTGTLTEGSFLVSEVRPVRRTKEELLELAALAESYSNHPISLSLKTACGKELDASRVSEAEELSGRGVKAKIDGKTVYAGNRRLMEECGVVCGEEDGVGTAVFLCAEEDGDLRYEGYILISDRIKSSAAEALAALKALGVAKTVMLTGDKKAVAEKVGSELPLDCLHAELLPADKVAIAEKELAGKAPKKSLLFVGDGVNDAPVLALADVGVAMGALGSDAAIEAADVVIMDDDLKKLPLAIRCAKRTVRIMKENVLFSLLVKLAVLILSALGFCTMWEAVFADVGVMVIAVINAMRAMRVKEKN